MHRQHAFAWFRHLEPQMFPPFDKLQIVTIQQILDGERMNLPLMEEVTKKAQKAKKADQPTLLSE